MDLVKISCNDCWCDVVNWWCCYAVQWRTTRLQCSHIGHGRSHPPTSPTRGIEHQLTRQCHALKVSAFIIRITWGVWKLIDCKLLLLYVFSVFQWEFFLPILYMFVWVQVSGPFSPAKVADLTYFIDVRWSTGNSYTLPLPLPLYASRTHYYRLSSVTCYYAELKFIAVVCWVFCGMRYIVLFITLSL